MQKITRISYNSSGWQKPTGDAREHEQAGTYNHEHGFGHEDWLFRNEWLIDGWRYSFLQGVNKSHARLVREGQPVDLTLFTIRPDKQRQFIGTIQAVECLNDSQAMAALNEFKKRGWFDIMQKEVIAVDGKSSALGDAEWAKHILNVRFRLENVSLFPVNIFVEKNDPIQMFTRYMLYDYSQSSVQANNQKTQNNTGSADIPLGKSFRRGPIAAIECTPEHAHMQAKLMRELQAEYPYGLVLREENFIDVSVRTDDELLLFEIKSDLEPRTVIRQALGQILEYAYHPARSHDLPVSLFIVGRNQLSTDDSNYLNHLKETFMLPINYRVVSL